MREDRPLSIRMIAKMVVANKERVKQIFKAELNITKAYAKMIPKNFTPKQMSSM